MSDSTNVVTPIATLSYPHLAEAQAPTDGKGKAKFSCALVFAKGTDLTQLQLAALAAAKKKFGEQWTLPNGTKIPIAEAFAKGALRSPFRRDGEMKGYPEGSIFLNVRTEQRPGCVDAQLARIPVELVKEKFYAGCKVKASLAAFGYDNSGNKGVSFGLNNIQFIADGERIDGRKAAEQEFTAELAEAPADLAGML